MQGAETPIFSSIRTKNIDITEYLINMGADIGMTNNVSRDVSTLVLKLMILVGRKSVAHRTSSWFYRSCASSS